MKRSISLLTLLGLGAYLFMSHPKFGRRPRGSRLERIKRSPNYRNGQFQNLSPTPSFTEGATYFTVLKKVLFEKAARKEPSQPIPSTYTDLHNLSSKENVVIWFGHSSYFMQLDGKKILVDPVFSGNASPIPGSRKSFEGTDRYSAADIPDIDYLFLTHDHWDHLDYETLSQLKPRIRRIITGLGVGEHLEKWGFNAEFITETDWDQEIPLGNGFTAHSMPARHFSGRGFKRNVTLWSSFILKSPTKSIYLGGDSGYDEHFRNIGERFGPFDLAILENGQYNKHWKYIHMMPHQNLQAAKDLKTARLLSVHNSKFNLANHPWDEPLKTITRLHDGRDFHLVTPRIGEKLDLQDPDQTFSRWWEEVD